jgi:hypothetical protein
MIYFVSKNRIKKSSIKQGSRSALLPSDNITLPISHSYEIGKMKQLHLKLNLFIVIVTTAAHLRGMLTSYIDTLESHNALRALAVVQRCSYAQPLFLGSVISLHTPLNSSEHKQQNQTAFL